MNDNYGEAFFLPLSENYHCLKLWPEQAAKHLCKSETSCLWESRAYFLQPALRESIIGVCDTFQNNLRILLMWMEAEKLCGVLKIHSCVTLMKMN
ncbi:hypothetical protein BCR33DRAFT_719284, partial [Rhizoclosmatium globosum]